MSERQVRCVQGLPRKRAKRISEIHIGNSHPARFTVSGIPDNRPSACSQVRADLMRAAGDQPATKQGETGARRRDFAKPLETRQAGGAFRRRCSEPAVIVRIAAQP